MSILEHEAPNARHGEGTPRHGELVEPRIVAHYQLVAPLMEQIFGRIPIVWTTPNPQPNQPPIYHGQCFGHYSQLSSEHVQHLASIGAQEFHSWFPMVEDPLRARFARFLLERPWADTRGALLEAVRHATQILGEILKGHGYGAIPVLDGVGGVSLFVPLAGGPAYPDVRAWAHAIAREAIAAHPDLLSEAHNVLDDGRVHIHVSSNAKGLFSILPYSVRTSGTRVATPVTWDELPHVDMMGVMIADFATRLSSKGDVFGASLAKIEPGPLQGTTRVFMPAFHPRVVPARHGAMVSSVMQILADGKSRTCAEIWKIGHERKLPACGNTPSALWSDMLAYIERQVARGRKPAFIESADHTFRINEPQDAWPDAAPEDAHPRPDVDAVINKLFETATDSANSDDFEVAVCDAFAALGLLATHVGGHAAPDGYADAPLGAMGYRVMIECKSGTAIQRGPDVYEAAKYKDDYKAQYCALVGSASGTQQQEALSEIKTHGVSLWGADDIAFALRSGLSPLDLAAAFAPGAVAQDVLPDIVWARDHGQRKRVGIIADIIRSAGWTTQCAAAQAGTPADSPMLTEDAAMLLVDQELAAQGAHVNCTREEVRLAFEWLTNPLNRAAAWNAGKTAIVITRSEQ